MARKRRQAPGDGNTPAETRMVTFAEDLGRLLGNAQAKASAWLDQRQQISKQLRQVRDTAERLLDELAAGGAKLAATARGVRNGARATHRPRRRMSAETRRRLSEAAKRRWAERKAKSGARAK